MPEQYICLVCFHEWEENEETDGLRCPMCVFSAVVRKSEFDNVVRQVREVRDRIRSQEPMTADDLNKLASISTLTIRVRPGPFRIMKLRLEVFKRAGL